MCNVWAVVVVGRWWCLLAACININNYVLFCIHRKKRTYFKHNVELNEQFFSPIFSIKMNIKNIIKKHPKSTKVVHNSWTFKYKLGDEPFNSPIFAACPDSFKRSSVVCLFVCSFILLLCDVYIILRSLSSFPLCTPFSLHCHWPQNVCCGIWPLLLPLPPSVTHSKTIKVEHDEENVVIYCYCVDVCIRFVYLWKRELWTFTVRCRQYLSAFDVKQQHSIRIDFADETKSNRHKVSYQNENNHQRNWLCATATKLKNLAEQTIIYNSKSLQYFST